VKGSFVRAALAGKDRLIRHSVVSITLHYPTVTRRGDGVGDENCGPAVVSLPVDLELKPSRVR